MKAKEKRFIVRNYVMALSASHALKREKSVRPVDCWIDDEWMKENAKQSDRRMGF